MTTTVSSYGAEIAFSPKWWSYVSSTRIMVSSFCNVELADETIADKIALAAQELLENAVKYSASPAENVALRFTIQEGDHLALEVSNTATPEQVEALKAQHAEIMAADPLTAYLQRMQRIAANPDAPGSQLGLARIRYEAGAELELSVDGQRITLRVQFPLTEGAK